MKNKSLLLTIISCIGVGATSLVTYICTKRACDKKRELSCSTPKETLKATWTCYIPTFVVGGLTVGAIIFNQKLTVKQIATILASSGLSTKLLHEYEQKTKELIGETKFEDIKRSIAKDHEDGIIYAVVPVIDNNNICGTCEDVDFGGDELFYDIWNKKWFRSSMSAVRMAEYHINRNFVLGGCVSLADFYMFLGLPFEERDEHCGWGYELIEGGIYWIDFEHTKDISSTGEEYTIISYTWAPEVFTDDEEFAIKNYPPAINGEA